MLVTRSKNGNTLTRARRGLNPWAGLADGPSYMFEYMYVSILGEYDTSLYLCCIDTLVL